MIKIISVTVMNLVALEVGLLNTQVRLEQHHKVWPKSQQQVLWILSHLKLELSMSFCSTNRPLDSSSLIGFVEHLSQTWAAQQSETKITATSLVNFVTPKVGAKNELLFNKSASGRISRMWPLRKKMENHQNSQNVQIFSGGEKEIFWIFEWKFWLN